MIKLGSSKDSLEPVDKRTYPDGTPLLQIDFSNQKSYYLQWFFDDMSELFILYSLTKKMKEQGVHDITLDILYMPNARMDRVKNSEDFFVLKDTLDIIKLMPLSKISVLDPHSQVTIDIMDKWDVPVEYNYLLKNESLMDCIKKDSNFSIIFYPDKGAFSKYTNVYSNLDYPIAFGEKIRNWETGVIEGLDVKGSSVKDETVLIIDDISSYGGTFLHSAKKLKELGAKKIYLLVTHCENSILKGELIKKVGNSEDDFISKIYTTESIFTGEHPYIQVVDFFRNDTKRVTNV